MSLKKILLIALILFILAAIPVSIFLVKRQQELRSRAAPATNLSLIPGSSTQNVGATFELKVAIDTGTNVASAAEIHLEFDKTKLSGVQITAGDFMPVTLIPGSIDNQVGTALIAVGTSPAAPKMGQGTIALISFKAIGSTGTIPTQVRFTQDTQVAGIEEIGNVLVGTIPASIAIAAALTPTPTLPPGVTPTPTPTLPPGVTPTPTPLAQNQPPTCTSLSVSPATGNTPLTVTLTANATDSNNDVLAALFTFGDGQTQTVDKNVGQSGSFQVSHVYTSVGNIGANAMVRDRDGAWSTACTASIMVAAAGVTPMAGGPIATPTPPPTAPTAVPTLPVSGDIGPTTFLAIAGAALSIIGALLFFAL